MTHSFSMTIGGEDAAAPDSLRIVNPANGLVFAEAPDGGEVALERAVAAARAAAPAWRASSWSDRQACVARIGDILIAHCNELAALLVSEQGKPHSQAEFEIMGAAGWCAATAGMSLPDVANPAETDRRSFTRHVPVGIVGAISPWNFPVMLSIWKVAPALLAGNVMVLKPSPFTPLTMLRIGTLLRGVLPPGVLNIITGGDRLGPLMTAHPAFGKIAFTGSTATGRRVMAGAAPTLKRLTLELGGNDPAIICPDANIEATAERLFWSAFTNSGQICVATKRAYVHESIYDAIFEKLVALLRSSPMGDGLLPETLLGPVQNRPQYERLGDLISRTEARGERVVRGAAPVGQGYFHAAALVDDPADDSPVVQEEQFGPILPLMRYRDEDEVIARANNSEFGLAATIWSRDTDHALRMAARIEAGNVWINEALALSPFAAFGGVKQSGVGVENARAGLEAYTDRQTIAVAGG